MLQFQYRCSRWACHPCTLVSPSSWRDPPCSLNIITRAPCRSRPLFFSPGPVSQSSFIFPGQALVTPGHYLSARPQLIFTLTPLSASPRTLLRIKQPTQQLLLTRFEEDFGSGHSKTKEVVYCACSILSNARRFNVLLENKVVPVGGLVLEIVLGTPRRSDLGLRAYFLPHYLFFICLIKKF